MARERVGFVESFRASKDASDAVGGEVSDSGLLATLTAGFWWWIVGVPETPEAEDKPKD
jgi:hypothetical protein